MNVKKRAAPIQEAVATLLDASPLPWTFGMIRDWFGWDDAKASSYLTHAASHGRISNIGWGLYTARGRVPVKPPSHAPYRNVTFSARIVGDVVTDDMLARYGFNL